MKLALYLKFTQHPNLLQKLQKETELIEYNNWVKDIDAKEGKNMLGILLQEVKDNLKVF